jgi:flavin-dependent dehydrogenase
VFDYQVVIVGSGPAGASTAMHLARHAPKVAEQTLLLERARHPREKICAGGLSQHAVAQLVDLGIDMASLPAVRIEGAILQYSGWELVAEGEGTYGLVVRRNELDALLAHTARDRGVELCEEEPLEDLRREGEGWRLRTPRRELTARVVVAADGAGSLTRRRAGFPKGRRSTRLVVVETPVDSSRTREFREGRIGFDFGVIAAGVEGYYWDFPCFLEGRPHLSRGIFDRNEDPARRVDLTALLGTFLAARGEDLGHHRLKSFPEREYQFGLPASMPGVLLVGEAAGIDPLVGEGIAQALEYGSLAALELARAFGRGDFSFRGWRRRILRSRLGRTLLLYRFIADRLYGEKSAFWFEFLGRRKAARDALSESFLGQGRHLRNAAVVARELLDYAATR